VYRRFTFQKRSQFFIGARNETPLIVAVRISNEDYRISVAAGADRGFFKSSGDARFARLCCFWIFAYSVQGRFSKPFPSFLSQLSGAM